jgi:hypothetical protein
MIFKLALVLLSALGQTTVLVESTSTDIRAGGEKRTSHLRKMKKVQVAALIAIKDGDAFDEHIPDQRALKKKRRRRKPRSTPISNMETKSCDSDKEDGWEVESNEPWSHGTFEVAAKSRDNVEVCTPSWSQVGDMLVLFIRYVHIAINSMFHYEI